MSVLRSRVHCFQRTDDGADYPAGQHHRNGSGLERGGHQLGAREAVLVGGRVADAES